MPLGWEWHLSYYSPQPNIQDWDSIQWLVGQYHDYALCPEHVHKLREQLKLSPDSPRQLEALGESKN
jgi:hypothetical protein